MAEGNNNRGNGEGNNWSWWMAGAAAVTAAAGAAYMMSGKKEEKKNDRTQSSSLASFGNFLENLLDDPAVTYGAVAVESIPLHPRITNLNSLLADIYVRHVALKREDFKLHYRVFCEVFGKLHSSMKKVDKYYERYSSNVQFAGSHYDRLRIKKPDEFDVDIVIGLPVNFDVDPYNPVESDIVIEQYYPGFVQLRAGVQYQKILIRDGADSGINKTAYTWLDERKYILRSKFTSWFKSVGTRALNQFSTQGYLPVCYVDGVAYTIRTSESGPAWTLIIEDGKGFKLDVDLVPSFRFPENRFLTGKYRSIPPNCTRGYWLVVPKPNKSGNTTHDENRSWRIALQDQEKQMLNDTYQLRQAIRLLKKLRDSQGMNQIASYHIKTLFFWEIVDLENKNQRTFWRDRDMATLFKHMLQKFYEALDKKEILFFWHRQQNMIANINQSLINEYKYKISKLIAALQDPSNYREAAKFLLTNEEYESYKKFLY